MPGVSVFAASDVSPEKREAIVRLTSALGVADLGHQMAEGFMNTFHQSMRQQNPEVSERAFEIVTEEILNAFKEREPALIELFVEIYDRHYTLSEIHEMEAFYATPLGQKSIKLLPTITREGMEAGQLWAQDMMPDIMPRIQQRLRKEAAR